MFGNVFAIWESRTTANSRVTNHFTLLNNGQSRMKLTINNKASEYLEELTVRQLLEQLGLSGKYIAVERNREIVSYTKFDETLLRDGDSLEIVTLVGGG